MHEVWIKQTFQEKKIRKNCLLLLDRYEFITLPYRPPSTQTNALYYVLRYNTYLTIRSYCNNENVKQDRRLANIIIIIYKTISLFALGNFKMK